VWRRVCLGSRFSGTKAPDEQKHAVGKTASDPFVVAFHELAGLALVVRKPQKHDEHLMQFPLDLDGRFYQQPFSRNDGLSGRVERTEAAGSTQLE